jgi:hypothetical protein
MTFRVDRLIEEDVTVLRLSGRIKAEELDVLRAAVEEESGAVAIDLKDVGLIDDDASGSWQSSKPTAAHSESVRPSSGNASIESGRRRGRTSRKREDEQGEHGDEG